jgi:hypothetical protein
MGVRSPIRSRDGKLLLAPEQDAPRQPPSAPRPASSSGWPPNPYPSWWRSPRARPYPRPTGPKSRVRSLTGPEEILAEAGEERRAMARPWAVHDADTGALVGSRVRPRDDPRGPGLPGDAQAPTCSTRAAPTAPDRLAASSSSTGSPTLDASCGTRPFSRSSSADRPPSPEVRNALPASPAIGVPAPMASALAEEHDRGASQTTPRGLAMSQTQAVALPTRSRIHWPAPLILVVVALAPITLAYLQGDGDQTVSPTIASKSAPPLSTARSMMPPDGPTPSAAIASREGR